MYPRLVGTDRAAFSATYRLNASQSIAWHSADAEEREHVRAEIRAAAIRGAMHGQAAVPVYDLTGALLERISV